MERDRHADREPLNINDSVRGLAAGVIIQALVDLKSPVLAVALESLCFINSSEFAYYMDVLELQPRQIVQAFKRIPYKRQWRPNLHIHVQNPTLKKLILKHAEEVKKEIAEIRLAKKKAWEQKNRAKLLDTGVK